MRLKCMPWMVAASCWFLAFEARAADLAVMPVAGIGVSAGDTEALGVLFARAVARDTHVAVASPQETRPLLESGATPMAVAGRLGAAHYIELAATRVDQTIKLSGGLFGLDGVLVYRADSSGPSLEGMEPAISALAHALIWRKPVEVAAVAQSAASQSATQETEMPSAKSGQRGTSLGPKVGLAMPRASGTTFSPSYNLQFDARVGPPSYFLELGAGVLIPFDDYAGSSTVSVTMGYLEMGASHYLWAGDSALYLGGGVSPAIWMAEAWHDSHTAATCSAYAQLGLGLNRTGRLRVYGEVRLSQMLLAVAHPIGDGSTYGSTLGQPYRPMLIAFQGGIGW